MNQKGKRGRRILSLVFTLALILGLLPVQGIRAEDTVEVTITARYVNDTEIRTGSVTVEVPSDRPASEFQNELCDGTDAWTRMGAAWDQSDIAGYLMTPGEDWEKWDSVDWENATMGSLGDLNSEWAFEALYADKVIMSTNISYCYDAYSEEPIDDGGWIWDEGKDSVAEKVVIDVTADDFYSWDEAVREVVKGKITEALGDAVITTERGHDAELGNVTWDIIDWGGYCVDYEANNQMALTFVNAIAVYEKAAVHLAWWDETAEEEKEEVSYAARGAGVVLPGELNNRPAVWRLDKWDEETETDVPGGGGIYANTFTVPTDDNTITCYWLTGVNVPAGFDAASSAAKMWEIINAQEGSEITVSMPAGSTKIPKEMIFAAMNVGKQDVTLKFASMQYAWIFNIADAQEIEQQDQNADENWDMDLEVKQVQRSEEDAVPEALLSEAQQGKDVALVSQFSIEHDGALRFGDLMLAKGKLKWFIGKEEYAGKDVTVYYYNQEQDKLDAVSTAEAKVDADGFVTMTLTHASDYLIVVEESTEGQDPAGNGVAYQDDMESDVDASWTVTWEDPTGTNSERKISNEAENNTTRLWNFYSPSEQKVVISREITVAAGRYVASVDVDGQNASGRIILSDGATSKDATMSTTGWDKWTTATTGVLEAADAATLTLAIEVDLQADGWFDLDNVKVVTEKAKKIEELNTLISGCGSLVESEYTAESWQALQNALTTANAVIEDKESKTVEEISGAYQALQTAKEGLVSVPSVEEDITVEKIAGLPKDFIMGMDISSVMSEFASGVTYKDFEGNTIDNIADFCKLLKANGITHIRVRVWNDPYDGEGHGYGGGNNDVKTAKAIADGCRAAGLKMLVDFHCSDFWADPYKYQEPKAWYGYTLEQKKEALKSFICEALNEIDAPKDTVTMVQVGNETINGFVGEEDVTNMCILFQAGAEGVRKWNPEAKVVIQVTEPQNGQVTTWAQNLSDNKVEYDILATSYYPYWHGSLENLKSELEKVKTVYGKEAMVVETSYAYTLADSDGCENIVNEGWPDGGEDIKQPFTVQGQATAVRDLMSTVNEASGLGVFYWESAWLTVGDTTGLEGEAYEAQVNANREKWETYGSGWASSYAGEYDPYDAGVNYGGTAVENQAMFYPDGTPTAALHVWNYVKEEQKNKPDEPDNSGINTNTPPGGTTITIPAKPQYDGWAGVSAEQKAKLMQDSLARSESAKVTAPKTDDSNNAMEVGLLFAAAAAFCGAVVFGKKKLLMK